MWGKLETWGRAHPFALGLIIFAIGALLIYLFTRGGSKQAATSQPSDAYYQAQAAVAASGNQLQAMSLQAQSQANTVNAAVTANANKIAGDVALAKIASDQATSTATLGADVQKTQISANQEIADTASTLNAVVQSKQIDANVQINSQNTIAATAENLNNNTAAIVSKQIDYLLSGKTGPLNTTIPGVGTISTGIPGPAEIAMLTPAQQNLWAQNYLAKNFGVST